MKLIRLLKHDLPVEARTWVQKGIVTEDQANSLLALYGLSLKDSSQKNAGTGVLLALGALLIGAAIILLVGHNWQEIPKEVRLVALLLLTGGLNWYALVIFKTHENGGRALAIAGSLAVGATAALISQMYQLNLSMPALLGLWLLAIMPMLFEVESICIAIIIAVLSFVSLFSQAGEGILLWWYPPAVAALIYFCLTRRMSMLVFLGSYFGFLFYLVLAISLLSAPHRYSDSLLSRFGSVHVFASIGLAMLTVSGARVVTALYATRHNLLDAAVAARLYALRGLAITLIIFSFEDPWTGFMRRMHSDGDVIWICLTVFLTLQLIFFSQDRKQFQGTSEEFFITRLGAILGSLLLCILPLLALSTAEPRDLAVGLMIATNLLTLAAGVGLIVDGIKSCQRSSVLFGALLIIALGIARYIELIGGYIGSSIMFAAAGVALILLARYVDRRFMEKNA